MTTTTTIARYKPMLEIETYSGDVYYLDAAHKIALYESLKTDRFVEVQGVMIAVRDIKRVEDARIDEARAVVPPRFRKVIGVREQKFVDNTGRNPEPEVVAGWVDRLKNGERI